MAVIGRQTSWQGRRIAAASALAALTLVAGGTGGYLLRATTTTAAIVTVPLGASATVPSHTFQPGANPDTLDHSAARSLVQPAPNPDTLDGR